MIKPTLFLTLCLALTACNQGGNSSNSSDSNGNRSPKDTTLAGRYTSGCINENGHSYSDTFNFNGPSVEVVVINYSDNDCRPGDETEQFRSNYAHTYNGLLIEFTKGNYFYTLYDSGLVSDYNQNSGYCELNNWDTGIEQEITNKNCDGETFVTGEKFLVNATKKDNSLFVNGNKYLKN